MGGIKKPQATIQLTFAGAYPRLTAAHFQIEGEVSPGRQIVAPGRAKMDDGTLPWGRGTISMAILLLKYRLQYIEYDGNNIPLAVFSLPIARNPNLDTFWNAVNKPTWLDSICGFDKREGRLCNQVFIARSRKGRRHIEISADILPAKNVLIDWPDQKGGDPVKMLESLLATLEEEWTTYGPSKSNTQKLPEALALELAESIWGGRAEEFRISRHSLDKLNRLGLAARIRYGTDDLYLLPELGITAALSENKCSIEEIQEFTSLDDETVHSCLTRMRDKVRVKEGRVFVSPIKVSTVVFDWTDTLVNEYELDETICDFICADKTPTKAAERKLRFKAMLDQLEGLHSPVWYDYLYLGSRFGVDKETLRNEHIRNKDKIYPLCDVNKLLKELRAKRIRLVLATNCHQEVLRWRAKILKIPLRAFDLVVTSDKVADVKDKQPHFQKAIAELGLSTPSCLVISDDHPKDLVPAKALGFTTVWMLRSPFLHNGAPGECLNHPFSSEGSGEERRVSEYGTPSFAPVHHVHEATRNRIIGKVADYCVFSPEKVLWLIA